MEAKLDACLEKNSDLHEGVPYTLEKYARMAERIAWRDASQVARRMSGAIMNGMGVQPESDEEEEIDWGFCDEYAEKDSEGGSK